jgi:hypothetical protein
MNWYLVKLVFRIICGDGQHTAQFDEQLRLIEAAHEKEAFVKALDIGRGEEDSFTNNKQQLIQWKFINIAELYRLNGFIHGAELYSRIHETENADHYISVTHARAANIQGIETHHLLRLV